MLSYQHHYHAGNHADVLKHWVLLECLTHLQKKDKPFDYIDTHAGAGLYSLTSDMARKTAESETGIAQLIDAQLGGLDTYLDATKPYWDKQRYPGSPKIVCDHLRPGDHAWLFEMHPQTVVELREHCAQKRVSYVQQEDGFQGLLRRLPNQSRRALVLIDPSYEIKSDYQKVVKVMADAYKKMPQTLLCLWYPVTNRRLIDQLERNVKNSKMKNVHLFEMSVADDNADGMTGSGMIVVNPPWTLAERFDQTIPAVSQHLSADSVNRSRHVELIAE